MISFRPCPFFPLLFPCIPPSSSAVEVCSAHVYQHQDSRLCPCNWLCHFVGKLINCCTNQQTTQCLERRSGCEECPVCLTLVLLHEKTTAVERFCLVSFVDVNPSCAKHNLVTGSNPIRSPALLPSVKPSRMVGMAKMSVLFNLCTDLRRPSKTSWSRNLELRRSPRVRCWLVWSSIVLTFSYFSTKVSRTMATLPTCVSRADLGEMSCRVSASGSTTESTLDTSWSRGAREACLWVFP